MTKLQMKNTALDLMSANKANPKLTLALTELFEEFVKTSKGDTVKREKLIILDGNEYAWCNRHEVYEPRSNFKAEKNDRISDECRLAITVHRDLSKEIKTLNDELMLKAVEGEDIQEIAVQLKEQKEIRGGRYDFKANALQFPEVENFIYDEAKFIKDEDIKPEPKA